MKFERLTFARESGEPETARAAGFSDDPEPVASAIPLSFFFADP
jgi:hypothetical protein